MRFSFAKSLIVQRQKCYFQQIRLPSSSLDICHLCLYVCQPFLNAVDLVEDVITWISCNLFSPEPLMSFLTFTFTFILSVISLPPFPFFLLQKIFPNRTSSPSSMSHTVREIRHTAYRPLDEGIEHSL